MSTGYDWTSYCVQPVPRAKGADMACSRKDGLYVVELEYNDGSKAAYGYCSAHRDGAITAAQGHPAVVGVNCWAKGS